MVVRFICRCVTNIKNWKGLYRGAVLHHFKVLSRNPPRGMQGNQEKGQAQQPVAGTSIQIGTEYKRQVLHELHGTESLRS